MSAYLPIRKSQVLYFLKTPLYIKTATDKFVLYKGENTKMDMSRFAADESPQLFIPLELNGSAIEELGHQLKNKLKDRIRSGDLRSIKSALCDIVRESFQEPLAENLRPLPETIEIIYHELSGQSEILRRIDGIDFGGSSLIEHSVNVMVLVLNYCIFNKFDDSDAKKLSLGALLHDIGLTRLPKMIIESHRKLTDIEFNLFKTHPILGHGIIMESPNIDSAVATSALEHHERLDGLGYPNGIANVTFEGSLIGMLDCFDYLTTTQKEHRKKENPFGALKIIQDEMLRNGKFDKTIFRDLCLSLLGKKKFAG